jgi:hypothetical protein
MRGNVSAAAKATVGQAMKGTLNQKKAIKLLKENGWRQAHEVVRISVELQRRSPLDDHTVTASSTS